MLIAVAALGSIGVFVRFSPTGPLVTGFYRCIFAIPLLIGLNMLLLKPSKTKPVISVTPFTIYLLELTGGILLGLDICFWNISFKYTTLAEANLIVNLAPFLIFPVSIYFFGEKFSQKKLLPMIMALFGLCLLVFANLQGNVHILGDFLAFVAALFYAGFVVVTKILAGKSANLSRYMIMVSIYCALILAISSLVNHESFHVNSIHGWLLLFGLAFVSQVLGQFILANSIKYLKLQVSSLLLLMQPVFAGLYGILFFNEMLAPIQWLGITLVIIAIYIFNLIKST